MEVWIVVFDDSNGDYDIVGVFTSKDKAIDSVNNCMGRFSNREFPDMVVINETYEYTVILEDNARMSAFAFDLDVDYS